VRERLIDGAAIKQDDVLLVDVGGSFGHDLLYFRRKCPDVPGRLLLQDRPGSYRPPRTCIPRSRS
jgi:hypothetical protein